MIASLIAVLLVASPAPPSRFDAAIAAALADTHEVWPVPRALVQAVITVESAWNPKAVSPAGAIGLMQVMPFNAEKLGLNAADLRDPAKNILAGTRLLAVLLRYYSGDVISALIAYNARPRELGAKIPRNGETPAYVQKVLSHYKRLLELDQAPYPADAASSPAAAPAAASSTANHFAPAAPSRHAAPGR